MQTRRVLITGAGRGIGLELARSYLARGDSVIAAVREPERATELAALASSRLEIIAMDVASGESVRVARAACTASDIDVLINNAGLTGGPQQAPGMNLAQTEQLMAVNAVGPLRVYDAFVDLVRKASGTRVIVNVSSEAGSLSRFRASSKPDYAMSKAALNALTRWIAAKDTGLVCVSMDPGWTRTATGGASAPYSAGETADRMVRAIDALTPEHSGTFVDSFLATVPW
jgi:NAD(P)-dependent dehydrogenase (short-subunit alcohol dehydrogenase family)